MCWLVLEVVTIWVTLALIAGLALGSLISTAERMREEQFLELVFAHIAGQQYSR